ncbi:GNAT family N-acetyltransferase [Planobispora siamensis]|uniref:N-acetyltransferase n=1 Tax=Planobispora siamensis TaxID=936338 RepID=A0A8J3WKI8_9ACTN|nr:GNAT family N-acetyltransferase [Planobispora siamensis]GIH94189.1 N-acetyltransferase [Planobispora siamensis]
MTEQTEPKVADNPGAGRFEITVDGTVAGFAEYTRAGSKISLTHTEIDPSFEGRGLGSILARGALDGARAQGLGVLPFCPFIRGYIERHPEYLDLVPADQRARFSLPADGPDPA